MTETVNDARAAAVADIAAMFEAPVEQEAPETQEVASEEEIPEGEAPEDNGEGPETETDAESAEEDQDGEEQDEPGEPEIDPPAWWSKDEKEQFSSLPRDMQELVSSKISENIKHTESQKREAIEAKKAATAEAETLAKFNERIVAAAETAEQRFGDKWAGADPQWWARLAKERPDQYTELKAQYDADQHALQAATASREAAERVSREKWAVEEGEKLRSALPHLFTPEGKREAEELKDYASSLLGDPALLGDMSAVMWETARKAMLYDRAKASKPIPKKTVAKALPSKSAPPSRPTQKAQERDAIAQRAYGTNGQKPDRAAMVELMIRDGIV